MQVSVSDAKATLTDLVRRAENGEEIELTRRGKPIVQLVPKRERLSLAERKRLIDDIQASAKARVKPGPDAARSQDFLYDENGLPA
ncbi:MAG: type II toxin-antitoxin system prevent-host-death family antitoxin [Pacificimonas sp.]